MCSLFSARTSRLIVACFFHDNFVIMMNIYLNLSIRALIFLICLVSLSNMVAERPIAYIHFSAPESVKHILPYESFVDIRDDVVKGLAESNRFKEVILLSDSLLPNLNTIDVLAIRDSLAIPKNSLLVEAFIANLDIKENKSQDEQVSYDAALSMNLRFVDLISTLTIESSTLHWPKAVFGLSMSGLLVSNKTVNQAIKGLTGGISRDMKKISTQTFPVTASVFDLKGDKKDDIREMQILIDPDEKISKGDRVDVRVDREIGNRPCKKLIAEGEIVRLVNDSIAVCEVKKGSSNIKEYLSKDERIEIKIK